MYVLRRTVGTAIIISPDDMVITVRLVGLDFLGACALLQIKHNDEEVAHKEIGPGETIQLHPDVQFQLLNLAYATHDGVPGRVAEFGISAPRSIPIRRAEKDSP